MAGRHRKIRLDFYKRDTNYYEDKYTLELYKAFKEAGILCQDQLVSMISGSDGYYIEWNEDAHIKFRGKFYLTTSTHSIVDDVVKFLVETNFFDKRIFNDYGILTNEDIQDWYLKAVIRRKRPQLYRELLLVNLELYHGIMQPANPIFIYSLETGEHEYEYGKKQEAANKKPKKHKEVIADKPKQVPQQKPAELPDHPPAPVINDQYTKEQVVEFIKVPFDKNELANKDYTSEEFNNYVKICKLIHTQYPTLLVSKRQLTIAQFVELLEVKKISYNDIRSAVQRLATRKKPSADMSIAKELQAAIEDLTVNPEYIPDREYAKEVIGLFGLTEATHHSSLVQAEAFLKNLYNKERDVGIQRFKTEFSWFKKAVTENGYMAGKFISFIGTSNKDFQDGRWLQSNWQHEYENGRQHKGKNGAKASGSNLTPTPGKAVIAAISHQISTNTGDENSKYPNRRIKR